MITPSASYSLTLRLQIDNKIGMFSKVASAIAEAGGDLGAIDIVQASKSSLVRDVTINAVDEAHGERIMHSVKRVPGVRLLHVSDRTFLAHLGGKIEIKSKRPIKTRDDLSMVYTPGVARVCQAIQHDPSKVFQLTVKGNAVAIVTDGTAVLGLGEVGPEAALPVMEGKAMIFKDFADIDAFPICLATKEVDEIVHAVKYISPVFGAINLEDISAPRCFEVEERLRQKLDIPVFHDDQHGTAIVVLAALLNALKIVNKKLQDIKVVVSGVGAAGMACTKMLLAVGVKDIIGCDREGAIYEGRTADMNPRKEWYAKNTNPNKMKGALSSVIAGADLFLGLSAPRLLTPTEIQTMAPNPIVFALANPVPEILPEEAQTVASVVATGRSDYPNQINNALAFPGVFRGALDCRAKEINEAMELAAARAIAELVSQDELSSEYIIPSVFDRRVVRNVARAVEAAAHQTGVARRKHRAPRHSIHS